LASYPAGFLALGLSLSLFGAAVFSGILQRETQSYLSQGRFPEALRCLEFAERLNAWDYRYAAAKADYFENLFFSTKDPAWRQKSDEAFERVLDLEKADGQRGLEKAERLTRRLAVDASPEGFHKAEEAWNQAGVLLPFSGIEKFEEGLFYLQKGDRHQALLEFETAEEMEPNYAAAWVNAGLLLKAEGEKVQAREYFKKALGIYEQWKNEERIDPLEKQLVDLPPATLDFLKKETAR
jgi:tetratricopeptide (TPR) repeat protein